ncbi:hypothetical protein C8J57DRAFT_210398 [Mycena rebaudengoi]|nr:hypothetical protein C8J57DRAFT_210398 [Mycena rebaudengoi]
MPSLNTMACLTCSLRVPPLLRSLKLSRFRLPDAIPPWMASIVDLDWAQSTFSPRVVAHFPSLRHLTIDWHSCSEPIQLPSLTSLCLFLEDGEGDAPVLAETLGRFTVPALTDLSGQNIHGDHIPALFDSTHIAKSWSAVTSLVFTGRHPDCDCEEEGSTYLPKPISSPPLRAFPAVTSLSLIDVCYTAKIVRDIFRPDFALWPLRTVTIGTPACLANVDDLYSALTDAVRAARLQKREIPKFRLSPALFCLPYWQENNVDVELFEGLHFSL